MPQIAPQSKRRVLSESAGIPLLVAPRDTVASCGKPCPHPWTLLGAVATTMWVLTVPRVQVRVGVRLRLRVRVRVRVRVL